MFDQQERVAPAPHLQRQVKETTYVHKSLAQQERRETASLAVYLEEMKEGHGSRARLGNKLCVGPDDVEKHVDHVVKRQVSETLDREERICGGNQQK